MAVSFIGRGNRSTQKKTHKQPFSIQSCHSCYATQHLCQCSFYKIFVKFRNSQKNVLKIVLIIVNINKDENKSLISNQFSLNKGNAKRGVSPRLKIRPCDLDLWPWKSIGFQILLRSKYVPSLVKIHWRMLILECSQGCYAVKI